MDSATIDIADFTSDGLADIVFYGRKPNGEKAYWMRTISDSSALINSARISKIKAQAFEETRRVEIQLLSKN